MTMDTSRETLLLALSLALLRLDTMGAASNVPVTVYFQSECPYSRDYIADKLEPAYNSLSSIMDLEFVPVSFVDGDKITCRHGQEECVINMYQACALTIDGLQSSKGIQYVFCTMRGEDSRLEWCANDRGLNYQQLQNCANSQQGVDAIRDFYQKYRNANATGVPWITINGYTNNRIRKLARRNPQRLICNTYSGQKPQACL